MKFKSVPKKKKSATDWLNYKQTPLIEWRKCTQMPFNSQHSFNKRPTIK